MSSQSHPSKWACTCEKCKTHSPDGKVVSERTWYRHNPGGRKATYGVLTNEQAQAVDRIAAVQGVPRPGNKVRKRRHVEIEEVEATLHQISKRATGSVSCARIYAPQMRHTH